MTAGVRAEEVAGGVRVHRFAGPRVLADHLVPAAPDKNPDQAPAAANLTPADKRD